MNLESFLQAIPKVELHCHLYGTVRKETFAALVAKYNAPLTAEQVDECYFRAKKPFPSNNVLRALDDYLVKEEEDLYRIVSEYMEDASRHTVRYAEFFWNPNATVQAGIPFPNAQNAILSAIEDSKEKHGIIGRVVPAIDRERGVEAAHQLVDWMIKHHVAEAFGLGMDFNEASGPPEMFIEVYSRARDAGMRVTAHAGENGVPHDFVRTAVFDLQAERIEHGYTIVDSPELVEQCRERGTVFTVVPTNSYYLRVLDDDRWALDHPIRKMVELGLRVHPNTDNPTLHKVTQTGAWMMMVQHFGCTLDDLRRFMINGLDAAWIPEGDRKIWTKEWASEFDRLRASLEEQA